MLGSLVRASDARLDARLHICADANCSGRWHFVTAICVQVERRASGHRAADDRSRGADTGAHHLPHVLLGAPLLPGGALDAVGWVQSFKRNMFAVSLRICRGSKSRDILTY